MEDIKRILVVSRMTKYSRKAVHYGISLAKKYGAKLYVTHVVHDPFGIEGWNLPMPSLEKDYQNLLIRERKELDSMIAQERQAGMEIDVSIREGEPAKEILSIVKDERIDLVILLAHEEGHLEHFLFGRSNEALIRRMPCSILLVKKEPLPVTGAWEP